MTVPGSGLGLVAPAGSVPEAAAGGRGVVVSGSAGGGGGRGGGRTVIAGVRSGDGKTTVTVALMAALRARGLALAGFKCGPDYIDPMFHRRALGRPSHNLDPFFSPPDRLAAQVARAGAGAIALVEGVMGYYDGLGTTTSASTFEVASAIAAPVVLVIDGRGQAASAGALLAGFSAFRQPSQIAAVIVNRASVGGYRLLAEVIAQAGLTSLGGLPDRSDLALPSRHLGLVTADEIEAVDRLIQAWGRLAEDHLDLDGLIDLARRAPAWPRTDPERPAAWVRLAAAQSEPDGPTLPLDRVPAPLPPDPEQPVAADGQATTASKRTAVITVRPQAAAEAASGAAPAGTVAAGERATGRADQRGGGPVGGNETVVRDEDEGPVLGGSESEYGTTFQPDPEQPGEGGVESGGAMAFDEVADGTDGSAITVRASSKTEMMVAPVVGRARVKLAVARDAAFCFLYSETLELFEAVGLEVVFFSPLVESRLPPGAAALYLPGGYPEIHAAALSANVALRHDLQARIAAGLPTIAECGGFLYLHQAIDGWPMVAALPGAAQATGRLQRFGYATLTAQTDNLLGPAGATWPVHEFHYYASTADGAACRGVKASTGAVYHTGHASPSLFAAFPHLYLASNPESARRFADRARAFAAPPPTSGEAP